MKKQYFFSLLLVTTVLISVCSCKNLLKKSTYQKENNNLGDSNPYLAIIQTTQEKNESILNFYDKEFHFVKSEKLPYGTLSDYLTLPAFYQNFIYFIPRGVPLQKELELALVYNPFTNFCEEYDIGMPGLLQISVSDKAIFAVNELNFTSYISKYIKKDKKVSRISSDKISYDTVYYYNGFLYATGRKHTTDTMSNYIFQIDPNSLKILWKKDITKYGQGGFFFCGIEDKLYFTLPYNSKEQKNNSFMVLSLNDSNSKTKSLEEITLLEAFPQQIKKFGDVLLISHCDLIEGKGNSLSIFNPITKKSKLISLSHNILQLEVDETSNSIYILENEKLYQYTLNQKKDDLILQKKINIKKIKDSQTYYYTGGFFLMNHS